MLRATKRHRLPEKSFSVPTCYDCEIPLEKVSEDPGDKRWKCPTCKVTYFCPVCATCGKIVQPWENTGNERNIIVARAVCMSCWNDKDTRWDDGTCPSCGIDLWSKEAMKFRDAKREAS